jgi:N-acetylmuramoyl-L-alanine amidase
MTRAGAMKKILAFLLAITFIRTLSFTVVIDPGHGGKFSGAHGYRRLVIEKDAALDIGLKLSKLLKSDGISVIMTRFGDYHLAETLLEDLPRRVVIAKENRADLFISIHLNHSRQMNLEGFEIYVPYTLMMPLESYKVANYVHYWLAHTITPDWKGTLGNMNVVDRGIRAAKYNVLSLNETPAAILVELEYISSPAGAMRVAQPDYRQKLANALFKGITDYKESLIIKEKGR